MTHKSTVEVDHDVRSRCRRVITTNVNPVQRRLTTSTGAMVREPDDKAQKLCQFQACETHGQTTRGRIFYDYFSQNPTSTESCGAERNWDKVSEFTGTSSFVISSLTYSKQVAVATQGKGPLPSTPVHLPHQEHQVRVRQRCVSSIGCGAS